MRLNHLYLSFVKSNISFVLFLSTGLPFALYSATAQSDETINIKSLTFPIFSQVENEIGHFQSNQTLEKGQVALTFVPSKALINQYTGLSDCLMPTGIPKLNTPISLQKCDEQNMSSWRVFRAGDYTALIDFRSGTPVLTLKVKNAANKVAKNVVCPVWNKGPISINVEGVFEEGEVIRDAYSGETAVVVNSKVTFTPHVDSNGLILLESMKVETTKPQFDWQNATIYFVMTDRFENGNPENDINFGRYKDDGLENIGTFHGGDLVGLTQKLDYLEALGVNSIWISSPLEQMHGWVGGGNAGDFPHFGYHGYYTLDWTKLDPNMGTNEDLKALVDKAHSKGIRILFDVVMNHTGYNTLADMQQFKYGALYLNDFEIESQLGENWGDWRPQEGQNWHKFNDLINYSHKTAWDTWWGKNWIRSELGDYDPSGFDDITMSLASLPDIKTESKLPSGLPVFYANKPDTAAVEIKGATPRKYLINWLTHWVSEYGIDGFRIDTAKHVEKEAWLELKNSAIAGLKEWKSNHPDQKIDDLEFWMTGEAWGHGVYRSDYFDNGFDSMINFDFQTKAKESLACFGQIDPVYDSMSQKLNQPDIAHSEEGFNMLSYLSSHDTGLFYKDHAKEDVSKQKIAANLLLLAPGAVQIYYGDESARPFGPTGSDAMQGTRSDMNWLELKNDKQKQSLLSHWQKVSQFRQMHPSIGAGIHTGLSAENYYAFSRQKGNDKVMVVWVGNPSE
ncbi:alpha-amylase [Thorsellia anophelis]|uniref:Alpha-amylase n=1 Tax=Thorsellia anophelis DSM 18579 TaxID=1123402 RepID=A0A1H9ZVP3_9GAMM|nr:alpha-amylase [Thorsellia anophelis]SES85825.1 alpha-amylase [Thorsellia anophelis DSM 18579]